MRSLALVVGAGGQLGRAMVAGLARQHEVVALAREDLDIADAGARARIASIRPDLIINCAAYTDVDGAERQPLAALAANAWGVETVARAATEIGAMLVHFSTDFVFDGVATRPYSEDDPPNPQSTYASSKLLGEWFAAETPRHYVLRVESLFGGPKARSSVDRILNGILSGSEVRVFVDRTVSPSYVDDVVEATGQLIARSPPFGTYHCVNTGLTTWAGLAREIVRLVGRADACLREVRAADAGLVASRPQFAALSNAKLATAGIVMPTWQDALARYVADKQCKREAGSRIACDVGSRRAGFSPPDRAAGSSPPPRLCAAREDLTTKPQPGPRERRKQPADWPGVLAIEPERALVKCADRGRRIERGRSSANVFHCHAW